MPVDSPTLLNSSCAEIEPLTGRQKARFDLMALLADVLLNPVGSVDAALCDLPPLSAGMVAGAMSHTAFRRPLQRAVAGQLSFDKINIGPSRLSDIADQGHGRMALQLVTLTSDHLQELARIAACGILAARVKGALLRADRIALRDALGEDLLQMAIHEMQLRCPALADLDLWTATLPMSATHDAQTIRQEFTRFGLRVLCRFSDSLASWISQLLEHRMARDVEPQRRMIEIAPFRSVHLQQMTKLLSGRLAKWSTSSV